MCVCVYVCVWGGGGCAVWQEGNLQNCCCCLATLPQLTAHAPAPAPSHPHPHTSPHCTQDVASLGLLAEKLEGDKAVLERQLSEARAGQAELCAASQQYIAADSAIKSIHASEDAEFESACMQVCVRGGGG